MEKKGESKNKKINYNLLLILISLLLFLFFFLSYFHDWANSLKILLHFCDHRLCIVYSLIWLVFGFFNFIKFFRKRKDSENKKESKDEKKKKLKKWLIIFLIVLIIGIILMNIIPCNNNGKVRIDESSFLISLEDFFNGDTNLEKIPCEQSKYPECSGYCSGGVECIDTKKGDIGLCVCELEEIILNETDGGFDPGRRGEIIRTNSITGNSSVYHEDFCASYSDLREYVFLDDYFYNVSFVDCREYFDDVFACCNEGACVKNCSSYDCEEFATENGFNNFQGGVWSLGECEEISLSDCGAKPNSLIYDDVTYCCVWNCDEMVQECGDSEFPACEGICPPDNLCVAHEGECLCVPRDFQFCEDSYPNCEGYCEFGICISDDMGGCYCEENVQCEDSWETGCTGSCEEGICQKNETFDVCNCVIEEVCQDSDDGKNESVPGTCNDGNPYTDYCIDENNLMEFYCVGLNCEGFQFFCKSGCIETEEGGKCAST